MLDYNKAADFCAPDDIEEGVIVTEGYAAIRLAATTAHVRMCEHPVTTKHIAHSGWNETDGANTMK
jgi:hypothetical protein